jgi:rRNA processing protein Gar1
MLEINNVVYNRRYNTIGIVIDIFDKGEVRTDADGVVYTGDLKSIKSKEQLDKIIRITNATMAQSTENNINLNNLLL